MNVAPGVFVVLPIWKIVYKRQKMGKFDLDAALKKVCSNCKASTHATYKRNIRRLAKIAGFPEGVPDNKGWLVLEKGKALIKKLRKMPLNVHRHLFVAGSLGVRLYTNDKERSSPWTIAMNEASHRYSEERDKQQKSKTERADWPSDGIKSLQKAASIQKRRILGLLKKKEYTHLEAYEVQKFIILQMFSKRATRNSPATYYLLPSKTENTLLRPKGKRKFVVTLRKHKNNRSMGDLVSELDLSTSKILSSYLPKIKKIKKHDYLLSLKNGDRMTRSALSKTMLRLTKTILGLKIGSRLARVLRVTAMRDQIDAVTSLQKEMGHSAKQQQNYVRRD